MGQTFDRLRIFDGCWMLCGHSGSPRKRNRRCASRAGALLQNEPRRAPIRGRVRDSRGARARIRGSMGCRAHRRVPSLQRCADCSPRADEPDAAPVCASGLFLYSCQRFELRRAPANPLNHRVVDCRSGCVGGGEGLPHGDFQQCARSDPDRAGPAVDRNHIAPPDPCDLLAVGADEHGLVKRGVHTQSRRA
jgi:hypothetical protein